MYSIAQISLFVGDNYKIVILRSENIPLSKKTVSFRDTNSQSALTDCTSFDMIDTESRTREPI